MLVEWMRVRHWQGATWLNPFDCSWTFLLRFCCFTPSPKSVDQGLGLNKDSTSRLILLCNFEGVFVDKNSYFYLNSYYNFVHQCEFFLFIESCHLEGEVVLWLVHWNIGSITELLIEKVRTWQSNLDCCWWQHRSYSDDSMTTNMKYVMMLLF